MLGTYMANMAVMEGSMSNQFIVDLCQPLTS